MESQVSQLNELYIANLVQSIFKKRLNAILFSSYPIPSACKDSDTAQICPFYDTKPNCKFN